MSAWEDRLAIAATITKYNIEGDRARFDAFLTVFTEDGELELPQWRAKGRAGIRKALTDPQYSLYKDERRPTVMRHHLTTQHIELRGPDDANARTYFTNYSAIGLDHVGMYIDTLRRVGGEWLIAKREIRVDWAAEGTLLAPMVGFRPGKPDTRRVVEG